MAENQKIALRLKVLQDEIEDINKFYSDTLRDAYTDCGMEYGKSSPYNEETIKLHNQTLRQGQELEEHRTEKLYGRILNFSQTYLSMKDYLKKLYPKKKQIIEDFFSNDKVDGIARKDIGRDLKHNPENDLTLKMKKSEISFLPYGKIYSVEIQKKWFYKDIYSVEYCNLLYNELLTFLKENNF